MTSGLTPETIARLKARGADPAQRTDMAALGAGSVRPTDILAAQRAGLQSGSPEHQAKVREYLAGMNSPLSGMISNVVTGDGSQAAGLLGALGSLLGGKAMYANMGGQTVALGDTPEPTAAAAPADDAAIGRAEGELGFALPADLRAFYTEVANGEVGPGDGIYPLAGLARKWREMTAEPAGPQGQAWPANLLPILGDDELYSIDRGTGRIVYWDVEEVDIEDDTPADDPSWARSFKPVAESLDAWLAAWAG
jgi:hypothetical protein